MGPIGAPDGTVRSRRDYRLRDFVHRLHSTFLGQTIWCRHFEPAIPVLHQGEQPLEIGFGQAVFLQHVSHMVDHEVDLERAEEIDQVANDISGSVELKVPAIGGDLRYHRSEEQPSELQSLMRISYDV